MRAIADAADESLSPEAEGRVAAMVESSDGSMYPGIAAVNHKTCELVKAWDWYPEFVIVMLVPNNSVDTASIPFLGQERLAEEYEDLLARMDDAVRNRSIAEFAEHQGEARRHGIIRRVVDHHQVLVPQPSYPLFEYFRARLSSI